jgi:hypothetical protein
VKHARLLTAIVVISMCNVFDGLMTLYWVLFLGATEFNPILRPIIENDPFGFITAKTVVVTCLLSVLWTARCLKLARGGIIFLLCAYVGVSIYHLWAVYRFVL